MRALQISLVTIVLGVLFVFAVQNTQVVTVHFLNWGVNSPIALIIVVVYLLGMISGWKIVPALVRLVRRTQ
ncbi:lipopolysaccharide assembly protein LapA domain-containing protein [Singulisphaera rosea]